ncbi:hypothetical protein KGQ20_45975 [Catenulispora sp. NF23]|uniref:hypothetical protein n=1 Tax=Catenulispora pinistramenti TaxID=2705254 RepID=UPI001BA9DA7F|nr:hypothetical protein [Catenulispora pinistramenti]MBS2540113.1 hypothetical protein [Catenulispora pinistramenti]
MPKTWRAAHEELARDLSRLVEARVLGPVDVLFGLDQGLRRRAFEAVLVWTEELLGPDDDTARMTAIRLISTLFPSDEPFDPPSAWWTTPFGRAVLLRAGHPTAEVVSFTVAAAMLGITRQGVHDLARRGKVQAHPDGGVTVDSVQARLKERLLSEAETSPGGSGSAGSSGGAGSGETS